MSEQLHETVGPDATDEEDAQGSQRPPTRLNDGQGLEIATEADFGIERDGDGELQPVMQRIPGTEKAIRCKPVTPGVRSEYADVLGQGDADAERVAELWESHIVEGIGSDATAEYVEDGIPYGLMAGINQALKNSSGEEVFRAVREQTEEELLSQLSLIEHVDAGTLETLATFTQDSGGPT